MLHYFRALSTLDGLTLSVDKIVLDYALDRPILRDELVRMLDVLPLRYNVESSCWESLKIGAFRGNYGLTFRDGTGIYVGVALNAAKTLWDRCRLEFNPNKTVHHRALHTLLRWLNGHTTPDHRTVKRFDLAVDIPVDRANVRLVKDRRVYSERRHGVEWTEYLGPKSSTVGRCKVYNKTAEAKLDYPLTRLELTLDPHMRYDKVPWPKVYYIDTHQMALDELQELTDTQRFVLGALLEGYGSINDLGRRTREKLSVAMQHYCNWVTVSEADYRKIQAQLRSYLHHPFDPGLGASEIDPDQAPSIPKHISIWGETVEVSLSEVSSS